MTETNAPGILRAAALGLVTLCSLVACGAPEQVETPEPVRPVKLIEVSTKANIFQMNLPAVIEASNTSVLTFQVGGRLNELNVVEGQEVSKGTLIGRLDQRDFRNQLQQAQAQYNSADSEYQRAARLIAENAIAESVYEQRKTQRDVARASLDTAQKALDDTVLRTPFEGVIASVAVEQFENIGPQQEIVVLQTTGAAEALVQVPSTLVANAERVIPTDIYITLEAVPDLQVPAEILSFSTQADSSTQTFPARFKFTPPEDINILPGMAGTLHSTMEFIEAEQAARNQVQVPLAAILSEGGEAFVWVVDIETMTVSKRKIEIDKGIGEDIVVLAGLAEGETIAGAGASYLFEGMQIRPLEN
ncbi:MAG: efflux RND transporter periplasmic adaptor subunit [Henriciella sp.]|nr:efflux RND transporter periplasmic adaptor subunit [Henriciella sp.]